MNLKRFVFILFCFLTGNFQLHSEDLPNLNPLLNHGIPSEQIKQVGENFGEGLVIGAAKGLPELSSIPEKNIQKIFGGIIKGFNKSLEEFSQEVGSTLKERFGRNSEFSKNYTEVMQSQGSNIGSFLDGIGERLYPFIIKNGASVAIGLFVAVSGFYGSKVMWQVIHHKLVNPKPKIIIDSSKKISWFSRLRNWVFGPTKFPAMVFSPALKTRLEELSSITQKISQNIKAGKTNIKYRNLLLYGPPGTGKTMFALQLAKKSGMEFVMVTGSSFLQPGAGIAAIDELFRWAHKTKKGLCIFIDEADSLLSGRNNMDPTSENYRVVNHFLNYLGERTNKFMIILATNYPMIFDEAMQRRIDDAVEMPLPSYNERAQTLQLYRDTILYDSKQNGKTFVTATKEHLSDTIIAEIANQTQGFSYSDLQGIITNIKSGADITDSGIPTPALITETVQYCIEKKQAFNRNNKGS